LYSFKDGFLYNDEKTTEEKEPASLVQEILFGWGNKILSATSKMRGDCV
jgi:hypothetical protein